MVHGSTAYPPSKSILSHDQPTQTMACPELLSKHHQPEVFAAATTALLFGKSPLLCMPCGRGLTTTSIHILKWVRAHDNSKTLIVTSMLENCFKWQDMLQQHIGVTGLLWSSEDNNVAPTGLAHGVVVIVVATSVLRHLGILSQFDFVLLDNIWVTRPLNAIMNEISTSTRIMGLTHLLDRLTEQNINRYDVLINTHDTAELVKELHGNRHTTHDCTALTKPAARCAAADDAGSAEE